LYSGLQYAQAGRFETPKPWATVAGTVVDAREPDQTICPQVWTSKGVPVGQEDCLKLDVYKPPNATQAAVMVWIHGGGLIFGGKHVLDLSNFVLEGQVVVVAINYRLNVLGFFTSPNQSEPSNFGIRDQIAGLQWVQQNIAAFGGDSTSRPVRRRAVSDRPAAISISPRALPSGHRSKPCLADTRIVPAVGS
jgi:carboxylesterase type B